MEVPRFVVVVEPVPVVAVPREYVVVAAVLRLLVAVLEAPRAVLSLETPPLGPKCRGSGGGDSFGRCAPCVASLPAVDLLVSKTRHALDTAIGIPIAVDTTTMRRILPCRRRPQQQNARPLLAAFGTTNIDQTVCPTRLYF